jgi:enoyl-[acyl-carrier protein] reductase I
MTIRMAKAPLLEGKKGLIVGIANDQSIAWGCAKAFRGLGAELAVTYLNEKAKKFVEPLARELEAPILMPLDVTKEGETEAVFERIKKEWGKLDFFVHSIAFSPKDTLRGRVVDVPRDGFLATMDISCWTFIRMAQRHHVHDELLRQPDGGEELQHYGRGKSRVGMRGAVHGGRTRAEGNPGARHLAGSACNARRVRNSRI